NELEKDFARLSELTKGKIETLHLMGGEPLLHPEIDKIIKISRKYFPIGDIEVVTNGILLPKMNKSFWEMCAINKIIISLTRYPIQLDMDKILNLVKNYNVIFEYYNIGKKKMYKRPLDLLGKQNSRESFKICYMSNYCIQLKDGNLYTCSVAPYAKFFNDYFGEKLKTDEKNGINIYKANDMDEIFRFLTKPVPFCRYCNIKATTRVLDWKVSEKDINEWI
ncbi:MAG: radical SAM protein, partial [Elusimicrobiota bacterium]|nr:radical SAM protein [Elusimicrobiota bacterium]